MSAALRIDPTIDSREASIATLQRVSEAFLSELLGGLESLPLATKAREDLRSKLAKLHSEGVTFAPLVATATGAQSAKVIPPGGERSAHGTSDGKVFVGVTLAKKHGIDAFYASLLFATLCAAYGGTPKRLAPARRKTLASIARAMLAGTAATAPKLRFTVKGMVEFPRDYSSLSAHAQAACEAMRGDSPLPGVTDFPKAERKAGPSYFLATSAGEPLEIPSGKGWAKVKALACEAFLGATVRIDRAGESFVATIRVNESEAPTDSDE